MMNELRVMSTMVLFACVSIGPRFATGATGAAGSMSSVLACRALADAGKRLACFDRETASLDVNAATASAPVPVPMTVPPVPPVAPVVPVDPKKQFGLPEKTVATQEVAAGTRPADAKKIEAKVVSYELNGAGRGVFTLDNEQVWRQVESTSDMLVKTGDGVVISRGLLGSYWLNTASGRGCRVTRLR